MTKPINDQTVDHILQLARLLGEFGQIKRVTLLPNGELESDSHHSFALALTAIEVAATYAPELNKERILMYCLVHDLPELITGDMPTILASSQDLSTKKKTDEAATEACVKLFADYPYLRQALEDYEAGQDQESHFVYCLDKAITIPGHFFDNGALLHELGITKRQHAKDWYAKRQQLLSERSGVTPVAATRLLELLYNRLHDDLLDD